MFCICVNLARICTMDGDNQRFVQLCVVAGGGELREPQPYRGPTLNHCRTRRMGRAWVCLATLCSTLPAIVASRMPPAPPLTRTTWCPPPPSLLPHPATLRSLLHDRQAPCRGYAPTGMPLQLTPRHACRFTIHTLTNTSRASQEVHLRETACTS